MATWEFPYFSCHLPTLALTSRPARTRRKTSFREKNYMDVPLKKEDYHFTYRPIGILRSPYSRRIEAPHQSTVVEGTETGEPAIATLELADWLDEKVIQDLNGFERIWLIFAFHLSEGWKSSVKPPRGGPKRGVLATRSPHRPNSMGLSAVELVASEGRTLHLRGVDLLDGTPVLDIKPYVPYADAFPDVRAGWIDEMDARLGRNSAPGPRRPRHGTGTFSSIP